MQTKNLPAKFEKETSALLGVMANILMTGHVYESLLHSVAIQNPTALDLKDFENQVRFTCSNYRWWDQNTKREKTGSKFKKVNFGATRPRPRDYENDIDIDKVVKRLVRGNFKAPPKKTKQKKKPRFGAGKGAKSRKKCFY